MPLIRKKPDESSTRSDGGDNQNVFTNLFSGTQDERWSAARAVATLPGGIGALGTALSTETDPRIRIAMFTSLARIATPASVDAVLPYLRSDDANLRTGALDALRAMPEATLPQLPALLSDPDTDVRLLSCEVARGIPSAQAAPLLCDLLGREADANVCAAAVEVLAEIGGPSALPALRHCAERFSGVAFLVFAIRIAIQHVGNQSNGLRD